MTITQRIRNVQRKLGLKRDGKAGPLTWAAIDNAILEAALDGILVGDGTWSWVAYIVGEDIKVRNAWATAFGGSNDPEDSGETASGFPTKGHPDLIACSLPMDGYGVNSLRGSPIPKMPFGVWRDGRDKPTGAHVIASDPVSGKQTPVMPVIDLGPSGYTGNALDLSVAAARIFKPTASAINFKMRLDFRIIGGAKYALAPLQHK